MSTIHNPVNFEPTHYRVIGYFDNKPPTPPFAYGAIGFGAVSDYNQMLREWEQEGRRLFPERNWHRCEHCGQGNVRYVVAAEHIPTGKRVCFGDICEARFDFPGHDAFAAAKIRSNAQQRNERDRRAATARAFVEANPALKAAVVQSAQKVHAQNGFVNDVLGKLEKYGSISERQINAVIASLARDVEFANRRAAQAAERAANPAGNAPTGRQRVEGEIVSIKSYDSDYGHGSRYGSPATIYKMLVKLANGSRVFVSVPSGIYAREANRGDKVVFSATFTPKPEDASFAFGKRPSLHSYTPAATLAVA